MKQHTVITNWRQN